MQVSMEKIIIFLNQVEIQLKIAKTSAQKQNAYQTPCKEHQFFVNTHETKIRIF